MRPSFNILALMALILQQPAIAQSDVNTVALLQDYSPGGHTDEGNLLTSGVSITAAPRPGSDGKQYVAIVRGQPSRFVGSLYGIIAGFLGANSSAIGTPSTSPAIMVFVL